MQMLIYRILVGALLLCFGRKLFWLFVGVLGFIIASEMTVTLLHGQPEWGRLLISVVAGLVGVGVAIWMQKVAIAVSGFIAGGYFLTILLEATARQPQQEWVVFIVGGIVGSLLMIWMFNPALIILSSITGANLILQSVHLKPAVASPVFIALVILGTMFQIRKRRRPLNMNVN